MTIKKKIMMAGAITFILFMLIAMLSVWTHKTVLSNLEIRDSVNARLANIEKYEKWKNQMIRSISDIAASGHVPPFTDEIFTSPHEVSSSEGQALLTSGKQLVFLIGEKEHAVAEMENTFKELRLMVNDLYYELDRKIATVLAQAQMDQLLGGDASEIISLAPYVLKSLNQLTLVAMNSLISRTYSETEKSVTARNRRFLSSQLNLLDKSGEIDKLFDRLVNEIESLELGIQRSNKMLNDYDKHIEEALDAFDKAVAGTEIQDSVAKARSEVRAANESLEEASGFSMKIVMVFLFMAPALVIIIGMIGLNTVIMGPITQLADAMKNVESGRFESTAPVKTRDEIGLLAQAFNTMAAEIRAKVTELSRLNLILKESEAKYRTLVDNLPQRVFLKDSNLTYVSCNKVFAEDLGGTPEEITGGTDFDFFSKQLAEKYRDDDNRVILSGRVEEMEEVYLIAGKQLIVKTVKTPVWDEEGRIFGVLGIFWDITDRKRAEEELYLARFSLENAPMATFWLDSGGRIQFVNKKACQGLGYTGEELQDMFIWDIDVDLSPERYAKYWREMEDGKPRRFESSHCRKDGLTFPVEVFARQGEFNNIRLYFAFVNDVTDRKKLEEQLFQAQKMEAVGTLAGGVSHDFNNLLQAVSGHTEILLLSKDDHDPDRRHLEAVSRAVQLAAGLVNELLLFSRKTEAKRQPVSLPLLVEQACTILERTIPKMVHIDIHSGDGIWTVEADPVQMEQIIINLGKNASDAMPDGGSILIETENIILDRDYSHSHISASPGKYVLLTVSDTGCGIDNATISKIYEPFFTTKGVGKGTGLGLSTVYGIVKSHSGFISCHSKVDRGTTFKIYLPAAADQEYSPGDAARTKPPRGGDELILFVDDEDLIREFASEALEAYGYTVVTASSGEEALDIYSNRLRKYDLIVLDVGMPGMGGRRCLQKILHGDPDAKILIASGYSIDGQVSELLELGACGFVGKPYHISDFLSKVREVLDVG